MMHSLYGNLCHDPTLAAAAAALMDPVLASKDTTFTKIFVGGLPYHTTDKTLREYFEQFGDIEEAVVITDRQTGKSRGYGFVTMKDRVGAERACKDPNPIIDGRKANVNLAYLGAKPRNNLQLTMPLPLQAAIPTLLPGRLGLHQLYYPASPLLTSQAGLVLPSAAGVSPLSPSAAAAAAAGQYLSDYSSQAAALAAASNYAAVAAGNQAAYDPYAAYYGILPGATSAGGAGATSPTAALSAAQSVAAYQQALQQANADRQ